ncbi:MAG TPA: hypothetical protein PLU79_16845, partial [Burkholderiaceae bacterium]|nr:hypothetical protein [Burkholderiaceae bacterium]
YQWKADGVAIAGATGSTLTLGQAQVGKAISVTASYTDGFGTAESVTSGASPRVANVNDAPTGTVRMLGSAVQGQTLTAANNLADLDGMGTVRYQWKADGVSIAGATASTLTLTQAQVGKAISVVASYTDGFGTFEQVSSGVSPRVVNINDAPTGTVRMLGTTIQGQTLTAVNNLADADGMGTVRYQWKADGVAIAGANSSTLTLGQAQVGKAISVVASYVDDFGRTESVSSGSSPLVININDAPTGSLRMTGSTLQGQTLTAVSSLVDPDGLGTLHYQWKADGVAIAGATGSTLTLGQAQVGKAISVAASYVDGFGHAESVSSGSSPLVINVNDAPTGGVAVSGTAELGRTLTASNTLADADGMGTVSYRWFANGVDTGLSGNQLTLTESLVGKTITAQASYVDGFGHRETVSSAATAAVNVVSSAAEALAPALRSGGAVGDGNGDGLQDALQAAVVSAPLAKTGGVSYVTLVADADHGQVHPGSTVAVTAFAQSAAPAGAPVGTSAPLGATAFTSQTDTVGGVETFSLYVSASVAANGYWVHASDGNWVNLASAAQGGQVVAEGDKVRIDFQIQDGGRFDADHVADGHVHQDGVAAFVPLTSLGLPPDVLTHS